MGTLLKCKDISSISTSTSMPPESKEDKRGGRKMFKPSILYFMLPRVTAMSLLSCFSSKKVRFHRCFLFLDFSHRAGAQTNTLDKDQLTPFHAAIKAGNVNFVRFVLEHRGRSFEGYHPSKAAPSGRTPLQLAIDSGVPGMVELLVKDATTHDVEWCWKSKSISAEIKQILRTKVILILSFCTLSLTNIYVS